MFPHKDNGGFNIMLQAFPLDGKIVCREISEDEKPTDTREALTAGAATGRLAPAAGSAKWPTLAPAPTP